MLEKEVERIQREIQSRTISQQCSEENEQINESSFSVSQNDHSFLLSSADSQLYRRLGLYLFTQKRATPDTPELIGIELRAILKGGHFSQRYYIFLSRIPHISSNVDHFVLLHHTFPDSAPLPHFSSLFLPLQFHSFVFSCWKWLSSHLYSE